MSDFKYDELVQNALVGVVKKVLEETAQNGLPGNHHFYIRFRTDHPRVVVPEFLKKQHPEEVMIVIQYQYWNLKVFHDYFCVDLSFSGIQETLKIPFSALTAFVDPSVKFALQFSPSFDEPAPEKGGAQEKSSKKSSDSGTIISFDSLRKK